MLRYYLPIKVSSLKIALNIAPCQSSSGDESGRELAHV